MADITRRNFLLIASALAAGACGDTAELDPAPGEGAPIDSGRRSDGGAAGPDQPGGGGELEAGAPPALVPGVDLDTIPLRVKDFSYGVMAGEATPTAAVLWTRFTGAEPTLFVQIEAIDGPKGQAVVSREVAAGERADGGFVHVDAAGLSAGVRYRYAFFVGTADKPVARSAIGFVRAALAPGALETVTFGGTSCTHQLGAPYPLLADAAKRKLDFFIHGGDHVYTDAGTDAETKPQYRAKYGEAWGASGMAALHGSTGMLLTWDDHEILNNWNPEVFPKARLDIARDVFFEHRAMRRDKTAPSRLWKSLVWGNTLEVLMLDVRSERKPSTRATANAQFITPEQMAWLKERLEKSTAVFKFIATSVPITNFPAAAAGEADKWEGYPAQRESILDFIEQKALKGVWWLSGDLHFGSVGGIAPTGPRREMREVLMGPGGTNARAVSLAPAQWDKMVDEKNYTVLHADPVKKELTVEFIGAAGTIFKRTYPA